MYAIFPEYRLGNSVPISRNAQQEYVKQRFFIAIYIIIYRLFLAIFRVRVQISVITIVGEI
jgi:hypothetical protein